MSTNPSVTRLKSSFLTAQTRLLSAPLQLSSDYRASLCDADSPLSSKAVSDLTSKVNEKIRQHNRLVFSAQSQRHVAEQIESLYWNEVREALRDEERGNSEGGGVVAVERDVELTQSAVVEGLPGELEEAMLDSGLVGVEDVEKYVELRGRLIQLARKRDEAREKLARYKKLQELLRPYENPQEKIQPNLVTKDGEMSNQLDRMKVLLARVSARMGDLRGVEGRGVEGRGVEGRGVEGRGDEGQVKSFDQKLQEVMELG